MRSDCKSDRAKEEGYVFNEQLTEELEGKRIRDSDELYGGACEL